MRCGIVLAAFVTPALAVGKLRGATLRRRSAGRRTETNRSLDEAGRLGPQDPG